MEYRFEEKVSHSGQARETQLILFDFSSFQFNGRSPDPRNHSTGNFFAFAMTNKVVYLMRGLPSCGKSFTARKLAGDTGMVCETDEYFYTEVGEDRTSFDYRDDLVEAARQWNLKRFRNALEAGTKPIVVDRNNGLTTESQTYVRIALEYDYSVQLCEPNSPWWKEISTLLRDKGRNGALLDQWAIRLARANKAAHRVPASNIRRMMERWECDLTVEDILRYKTEVPRS